MHPPLINPSRSSGPTVRRGVLIIPEAPCAWLRNRAAAINLRTLINAGLTRHDGAWALT